MAEYPPFDPKELEVTGMHLCGGYGMFTNMGIPMSEMEPLFNRPITPKENLRRLFSGEKPCWIPFTGAACCDVSNFAPRENLDNYSSRIVMDGLGVPDYPSELLKGWFDLEWLFVPTAGGATVKPGNPMLEDMNDWEDVLVWPDLDSIDWEAVGRVNREYLDTPQSNEIHILSGSWERLMSLMDVSGAAMALIDEDQADALQRFLTKYTDFIIDYIGRLKNVCDVDGVLVHDDWGTQNGPFFSEETAREVLFPHLKRLVEYIHSQGMYYEQHSCGHCTKLAHLYVEAGVDLWWPQPMNDFDKLLEMAEGTRLHIAMDSPISPFATEEEARQAAREWFAAYGDKQVTMVSMHPAFSEELYKLSRIAFAA